jgi:hypothetical protein
MTKLWAECLRNHSILAGVRDLSLLQNTETGSTAHPALYSNGTSPCYLYFLGSFLPNSSSSHHDMKTEHLTYSHTRCHCAEELVKVKVYKYKGHRVMCQCREEELRPLNLPARGGWSTPCPDCFTPRERAPLPSVQAGWVPGQILTGLKMRKSLALTQGPTLDHPACNNYVILANKCTWNEYKALCSIQLDMKLKECKFLRPVVFNTNICSLQRKSGKPQSYSVYSDKETCLMMVTWLKHIAWECEDEFLQ